ncbi:general stress protein [Canibacter zhoujuaniae]|uniref:general stress protein n=1 Tax=Canibacter zhoujuaniae TaxID=2708343 RepID=UPI001424A289|nr:general stress protein [Canibacter zhoujuaniae]
MNVPIVRDRRKPLEALPELRNSEVVSTYDDIRAAEHAVDVLSENGSVPATEMQIVGSGLQLVERPLVSLTYGKVVLQGAFTGLYFGLGIGMIWAFTEVVTTGAFSLAAILPAVLLGLGLGALLAIVRFATGRTSRFVAATQLRPDRFELQTLPQHVHRARSILNQHAYDSHR